MSVDQIVKKGEMVNKEDPIELTKPMRSIE